MQKSVAAKKLLQQKFNFWMGNIVLVKSMRKMFDIQCGQAVVSEI